MVWGLSSAPECDALTKPFGGPGFIDFPGCDSQHGLLGFVDVWRVGLPGPAIEVNEHHESRPGCSLVVVEKRMVPGEPADEDGRFVVKVRVELLVAKSRLRRVQG